MHSMPGEMTPDRLIRLNDVSDIPWLPARRGGAKLHVSTVWRWAMRGLHGHRLRTVRAGGTLCTSDMWLREFFEALGRPGPGEPMPRTPRRRRQEIASAQKRLTEQGI